jgi:hypothetical protein
VQSGREGKRHIPLVIKLLPLLVPLFIFFMLIPSVHAHCPLCTIGAMAAAGTAVYFGVKGTVVALLVGGFAVSMGWWISTLIKKQYLPYQKVWLVLLSFFTTVLPIMPVLKSGTPADYYPLLISLAGGYGSLLNRTYLITIPFVMAMIGGALVCITPWLSKKISGARDGEILPFQGTILTLSLLIIVGTVVQFIT